MMLQPEYGGYGKGVIRLFGSFQTNGTQAPTVIRDGQSKQVVSVTRVSAGLFEVTLDTGFPIPTLPINMRAKSECANPPVKVCDMKVVGGSWNTATRKFRIISLKVGTVGGAAAAPVVDDPDTGDRIGFEIVGSILGPGVGTDPA